MEVPAQDDAPVDIHAPFTIAERMQQLGGIDRVILPTLLTLEGILPSQLSPRMGPDLTCAFRHRTSHLS